CSSVSLSSSSFFSESASFLRTISSFSCGISLLSSSVDEDFCNRKYATKIIPITRTTTITVGKKEKTDAPLYSSLERSNLVLDTYFCSCCYLVSSLLHFYLPPADNLHHLLIYF